jgi:hypothetical protein
MAFGSAMGRAHVEGDTRRIEPEVGVFEGPEDSPLKFTRAPRSSTHRRTRW